MKNKYQTKLKNFVSIEGIDFTWKTTFSQWLTRDLTTQGMKVVTTRDPPYYLSPWNQLREFFEKGEDISHFSEAFLLLVARLDNFERIILPALMNNSIVIADRFVDSWIAYQSVRVAHYFVDKLEALEFLISIQDKLIKKRVLGLPGITIWILEKPEVAIKRAETALKISKYENLPFQQQVDKQYHILSERYPERIKTVDVRALDIKDAYINVLRVIAKYFTE